MKRGDLFRVRRPGGGDPKASRVFVVVSRQAATQVNLGLDDGLKHESSIHCDALVSLPKPLLTDYVASLKPSQVRALDQALRVALALA